MRVVGRQQGGSRHSIPVSIRTDLEASDDAMGCMVLIRGLYTEGRYRYREIGALRDFVIAITAYYIAI